LIPLGNLIIHTKIEKDHQIIGTAFKKSVDYWGDGHIDGLLSSVLRKLKTEEAEVK
jgi:hypothetical protein